MAESGLYGRRTLPKCMFRLVTIAKACEEARCKLWQEVSQRSLAIVDHSGLYASRDKNDLKFAVSSGELEKFPGIILLSGYHTLLGEGEYWSTQPDLGVPVVQEAHELEPIHDYQAVSPLR